MLKWLIRRKIAAFERTFDYDMSYARELLEADTGALLRFARVAGLSDYRRDVPRDAAYAAKLTGTVAEDCGPCTQLLVTMALREGVEAQTISAILGGSVERMSDDVRLAVAFARAVLDHAPAADELREEVLRRWGPRGLVSLAFGLVSARMYPTLKYAMGYGKACQRVEVLGEPMAVARLSA